MIFFQIAKYIFGLSERYDSQLNQSAVEHFHMKLLAKTVFHGYDDF